jgi:hypothetical protein
MANSVAMTTAIKATGIMPTDSAALVVPLWLPLLPLVGAVADAPKVETLSPVSRMLLTSGMAFTFVSTAPTMVLDWLVNEVVNAAVVEPALGVTVTVAFTDPFVSTTVRSAAVYPVILARKAFLMFVTRVAFKVGFNLSKSRPVKVTTVETATGVVVVVPELVVVVVRVTFSKSGLSSVAIATVTITSTTEAMSAITTFLSHRNCFYCTGSKEAGSTW